MLKCPGVNNGKHFIVVIRIRIQRQKSLLLIRKAGNGLRLPARLIQCRQKKPRKNRNHRNDHEELHQRKISSILHIRSFNLKL